MRICISPWDCDRSEGNDIMANDETSNEFTVIIERDQDGYYVAEVPELKGCHTQARSLDELMERIREAILLCLEVETRAFPGLEFVGLQRVAV